MELENKKPEEEQPEKEPKTKSFLKRSVKIFHYSLPVWSFLLLTSIVIAGVLFGTVLLTATVKEPLSVSPTDVVFDIFAGESKTTTFTLTNLAPVEEKAKISFKEVENLNGITYTVTFSPSDNATIPASGTNTVNAVVSVNPDSPIGTLKLSFSLERIA